METYPPPGEPQTFVELLAMAARDGGDRPAYRQKTRGSWQTLSFRDLRERARETAAGLCALGVEPGDRAVILLENGLDWALTFFAIQSAGAVAVPIYTGLKAGEIGEMIAHVEPTLAVVSQETLPKLGEAAGRLKAVIVADESGALPPAASPARFIRLADVPGMATEESRRAADRVEVRPNDLAVIVFTSGTAAGHKGVMLTQANLMANVAQARRVIPFGAEDRLLLVLPLHHAFPFMLSLGLLPALTGELVFENDLRRIRDRMAEVQPTLFIGVPALYEIMHRNVLQAIESQGRMKTFLRARRLARLVRRTTGVNIGPLLFRDLRKRLGGRLKLMVSGGAALNPEIQREFLLLGIPLIQGWGLTEASPALSFQKYSPWRFRFTRYYENRVGSIGQALPGVEIRLADVPGKGLIVAESGEGEILARGPNITPGYWRAPEMTAELLDGEWLKTGDIGTIDREGNIRITGRSKFIIVLDSGEKVYPDEIEEKLELAPAIADVAVRGLAARDKTIVSAVVYPDRDAVLRGLGEGPATADAIREAVTTALRAQEHGLASYKRVGEIVLTDEPLPRTALRKIMRGQLRDAYTFDPDRWARTWAEYAAGTPE